MKKIYILFVSSIIAANVLYYGICSQDVLPDATANKFMELMDSVRTNVSDSLMVETVMFMDFYNQPSSLENEYALWFSYETEHHNEEFDEPISHKLYEMFRSFPEKFQEMDRYLDLLPIEQRNKIVKSLLLSFIYNYIQKSDNVPSMDSFAQEFPYFAKYLVKPEYMELWNESAIY